MAGKADEMLFYCQHHQLKQLMFITVYLIHQ